MFFDKNSPESLFRELNNTHRHVLENQFSITELSDIGNPMILVFLERFGEDGMTSSQKNIANFLHVTPATITVSLKSMERLGYITRNNDTGDMRKKQILITEKGREAVKKIDDVFQTIDLGMYKGFSPEERAQISHFYTKMIENLEKMEHCSHELSEGMI
jgi:DNA-binding MarR family transcriptional regulator